MGRPSRRAALVALALLGVAGCADDGPKAGPVYDVATGADDVVVSVRYDGGFVPVGANFSRTPISLITGDGRALTTGPVPAISPGPLLPNVQEQSITTAAVQQLVATADRLGLLADVTYPRDDRIADAPDTIVEITVGGRTFQHDAYALGIAATEADAGRRRLLEFVDALGDLERTVGADALGPDVPFRPEQYLIQAVPADGAGDGAVVPWPSDSPVRLADATACAALPADVAAPLFADATSDTTFTDAGVTYHVAVVQQVPGRTC